MSDSFVGEIKMLAFGFPPQNWAFCDGGSIPNSQNRPLFSLLGQTFGGDMASFKLPDLRGRTPISIDNFANLGKISGTESVALTTDQMPAHAHPVIGTTVTGDRVSVGVDGTGLFATGNYGFGYAAADNAKVPMNPGLLMRTGDGKPHTNLQPSLVVNFAIALFGSYPQRSDGEDAL